MKKYPVYNEFVFDERPVCVYGNMYIKPQVNSVPVRVFLTAARHINTLLHKVSLYGKIISYRKRPAPPWLHS